MSSVGYLGHVHERLIVARTGNAHVHCLEHGIRGILDLLDALLGCGSCDPEPQGFLKILKAYPDLLNMLLDACYTSPVVRPSVYD